MNNNEKLQHEYLEQLFLEGVEFFNNGNFDQAILSFYEIIDMDKLYSLAYYYLGKSYLLKNEKLLSMLNLQRAVELSSFEYKYIESLIDFYARIGLYDIAAETLLDYTYTYSYDISSNLINTIRKKLIDVRSSIPSYKSETISRFEELYNGFNTYVSTLDDDYISCDNIEGMLMFGHNFLGFCCVTHTNPQKGNVKICDYNGEKLPLEDILMKRKQLRNENSEQLDNACKGCFMLQKKKWKKDYLFDKLLFAHSIFCNLECIYCYTMKMTKNERESSSRQTYNSTNTISYLIEGNYLAPNSFISYAGGEPTIFVDFDTTMKLFLEKDVTIQIATNSTRFSELVNEGLKMNKLSIITSIDSGTKEKYEEIRGKNLFDFAWKNLSKYADSNNAAVTVQYIFLDENYSEDETRSFVDKCKDAGIKNVAISRDFSKYNGSMNTESKNFPLEIINSIANMIKMLIDNNISFSFMPHFTNSEINSILVKCIQLLIINNYTSENIDDIINRLILVN